MWSPLRSHRRPVLRGVGELFRTPASALGTTLLVLFIFLAVVGPWLAPYGPTQQIARDARQAPSWRHWFGTDLLGRDVFSRLVHGTRSILSLTGLGALLAVLLGTLVGLLSGYRGGRFDEIVMRILDSLLAIPAMLLALVLLGAVGRSQTSVLAVIAVVYFPIVARVVRSEVLAVKALDYIETARLRGESLPYLLVREILPSVLPALSVEAALRFSYGIFLVASLGYLGVGVQPPTPDWGLMVREARTAVRLTPWALYFPAGAIALLVIAVNLTADGLKRALQSENRGLSPRQRARVVKARQACRVVSEKDRSPALLSARELTVSYSVDGGWVDALRGLSLDIHPGETVGVVGESGSGKSTLALAIVQYLSANGAVRAGSLCFEGESLLGRTRRSLRRIRRDGLALIPQDPMASLNPSIRVGAQIDEAVRQSASLPDRSVRERTEDLVTGVGIPDATRVLRQYPHQLSGGMQQRMMIAMALAANPKLLILDEPTTGLDVTTEATILDLVGDLLSDGHRAALYISHDLGVVAQVSSRLAVLYAGELVEVGPTDEVFRAACHPYTVGLLASRPQLSAHAPLGDLPSMPGSIPPLTARPDGCVFRPRCPLSTNRCLQPPPLVPVSRSNTDVRSARHASRCHHHDQVPEVRDTLFAAPDRAVAPQKVLATPRSLLLDQIETRFPIGRSLRQAITRQPRRWVHAVRGVSLSLPAGTTLGVVGESGSGKTTLARSVLGLTPAASGRILWGETPLPPSVSDRSRKLLRVVQAVTQNPDQALNPHLTVRTSLQRPLVRLIGLTTAARRRRTDALLDAVGLRPEFATRLPSQLSGGEKQRVAIARALAAEASVLLCDECTSALDVSVQARILNLLAQLQQETGAGYLFITHDLAVVAHLADQIAVLYLGELMEIGTRADVLSPPHHPYTEALLSSVPSPGRARSSRIRLRGEIPSPVDRPSGCPFHTRCPRRLGPICDDQPPAWQRGPRGHALACHIPLDVLSEPPLGCRGNVPGSTQREG